MTKPGFSFFGVYFVLYFCYGCMFAFVVFDLVFHYLVANRLAGKNVSKMTYFGSCGFCGT